MYSANIFVGSMELCGIYIDFHCNEPIYKEYLCELLSLESAEYGENAVRAEFIFKQAIENLSEDHSEEDVFVSRKNGKIIVREQRKDLLFQHNVLRCEINVKIKNCEAMYYTYILPALRIIMAENNVICMHASAFQTESGKCSAFVSPSGCGKSTLSTLLMKHKATVLTDDLFFIDVKKNKIAAFKRPAHVDFSLCEKFPWLMEWLKESKPYMKGSKKYNLPFFDRPDISYAAEMPIPDQFFFPVIANTPDTSFEDISFKGALMRILSQMYFHAEKNSEDVITFLDKKCRNYKILKLGTNLLKKPEEVVKLISKIDSGAE